MGGVRVRGEAPPSTLSASLTIRGCSSVHGGRLVALRGLGVLGEGWLLVIVHRRARVGGVGCAGVWGGIYVVLDEVVHSGLVALVGQGGQCTLQGAPSSAFHHPSPKILQPLSAPAHLPRRRWRRS